MKKSLRVAAALAVAATPAFAGNLENPLYMPKSGEIYSKTSAGYMFKTTDATNAQVNKDHAFAFEAPIWRFQEDLGVGIMDNLSLNGSFGYTHNGGQDRKGLHLGRLGLNYRIFEDATEIVWDVYADAHLGGVSPMTGTYDASNATFKYDNYGTGQYGVYVGTKVGKTWGDLTGMMYTEVGHFFAGDNTEINLIGTPFNAAPYNATLTGTAKLKSFTDFSIGTKWSYNFDEEWTGGIGFAWKHHARHIVKSAKVKSSVDAIQPAVDANIVPQFDNYDFQDSFNEFPITLSLANQITETVQVAVYGEFTADNGHVGSQNTTEAKTEFGVRMNLQF